MGEIRPGFRRSLRIAGKRPVSSILLSSARRCTVGCGCARPPVAKHAALHVSPSQPDISHSGEGERATSSHDYDRSSLAGETRAGGDNSNALRPALAAPVAQRSVVSSEQGNLSPSSRAHGSVGLARERLNLTAVGLPPTVVETIQGARAPSTRTLYNIKWGVFEAWCRRFNIIPYQCSVSEVLCFLQDLIDKGRAFSTIKVYLAAISACHVGFGRDTVGQHPLVCRFMKGARRRLLVPKTLFPSWDLSLVLDALCQHPFEPLNVIDIKLLSLKTALLLALSSAKRVGEIRALSVHPSCLQFAPGSNKVCLIPNPSFMPKVIDPSYHCAPIELMAFHPPPFSSPEEQRLNSLCPVRALRTYMEKTRDFRRADQLFVSCALSHRGKPISQQRLSHWIVDAIRLAYESKGLQAPVGLRAHSTRGMATSWALFKGVSVQDICKAASWASPHTFVRFYRLDVTAPTLAHSVLQVGTV